MPGMRSEVGRCLTSLVAEKGGLVATFSFPPDFIGSRGHFPDEPVLPAVCFIEAVLVGLEAHFRKRLSLQRVASAKFLAVVRCAQEGTWTCRFSEADGGTYRVKATIERENEKVAVLDLVVGLTERTVA